MSEPNSTHPWQDEQTLRELYVEQEMSTYEIADKLGCHASTVSNWLHKYDIETRDRSVAGTPRHSFENGYEYIRSSNDAVRVHRLVAVAEWGFDAVADRDIHHINGVKWDNRPANLAVLNADEHRSLHSNPKLDPSDVEPGPQQSPTQQLTLHNIQPTND